MRRYLPLLLCACQSIDDTRVFLHIQFPDTVQIDQVRVTGEHNERIVLGPTNRPDPPNAGYLRGEQTLQLIVPDDYDGKTVTLKVVGLWSANMRATGTAAV